MKYVFISFLCFSLLLSESNNDDLDIQFNLYNQIFEQFTSNYVDTLDKTILIQSSFDGMFKTVDPYTKLYIGSSKDRLEILTKGKYGGLGMQIGLIQDTLTVLSPYEDSPAYSEGIQAGDQILMVDSTSTIGLSATESSELIRGELDSEVILQVRRPYSNENITFNLIRANITVKDVPYWGVNDKGVGYIRIKKFSRNTAKDFRNAIKEILSDKHVKGLIIDLRGNTGGLLSNALNILDQLVPKGENLLKTKGRIKKANRNFNSKYSSSLPDNFPIVILVNRSSASASEIVAGTLQDLDLGLVLGQPTFGKGLVQRIYTINDTISLKVTTSKYYTPSGRVIQKKDYLDNDVLTDGLEEKDTTFFTKNGRPVKGGGGIYPDLEIEREKVPLLIQALYKKRVFTKFASDYGYKKELSIPIKLDQYIINDFIKYAKDFNIEYNLPGEEEFNDLKNNIYENYIKKDFKVDSFKPSENYVIVDAQRWLTIRNGSGKIIRVIPPEKHKFNIGEYYYTELGEIIPKTGFNDFKENELSYLTNDIQKYFDQIKLLQYNDPENIRWIKNALLRELSLVLGNEQEKIKVSLFNDAEYLKAEEIILDINQYKELVLP